MDEILFFKVVILLSTLIFILPVKWKSISGILLHSALAIMTTQWAIEAWSRGSQVVIDLGVPFWGGTPALTIDKLSAFFILIINLVSLTGVVYGSGYLKPYEKKKNAIAMSLHGWAFFLLHASMLHVVMLREGFSFLMAWEVMSMSSFLLVIFHGEHEGNLKTGIKYLVQMHAGFTFLLLGFLWVSQETGVFGFDGLAPYFASHSNWIIFLILFVGFGIKAGFMPLHTWLPHAHPAAPSSVSGVMSGVMIKMGIYGILRVLMDVQQDFLIIGLILLLVSIITGVGGIAYASMQTDLKKLLAYSSIENIGIIGMAIGVAVLGKHLDNSVLTTLALTGALFHILNHALYKSMLFYTAGNVYYAAHTRDMNKLGGIIQFMPVSGGLFLIGALSISAIPPFNGFISEFLIYKSAFQVIGTADFTTSLMILAVVISLVIIGGLSIYSFTKAFGISFLGSARSKLSVKEVPFIMVIPGLISVFFMTFLALEASWAVGQISSMGTLFTHFNYQTTLIYDNLPTLHQISMVNLILLVASGVVYALRKILQRKEIKSGPTWGCGYSAGDARHQYTPTSYANYIRELAGPLVPTQVVYQSIDEKEIFPAPRNFSTKTSDLVEDKMLIQPVENVLGRMSSIGWAQTGKISHYLVYPLVFLLIIVLLTKIGLL
ncbi:MAG: proton-conducting transporter membrane subunit [Cytophagales bacterium]|nr:proton-conducting transporter membrane subunit [Cytophagales bacterium]